MQFARRRFNFLGKSRWWAQSVLPEMLSSCHRQLPVSDDWKQVGLATNHLTTVRANHSNHFIRQFFLSPGWKDPVKETLGFGGWPNISQELLWNCMISCTFSANSWHGPPTPQQYLFSFLVLKIIANQSCANTAWFNNLNFIFLCNTVGRWSVLIKLFYWRNLFL